MEQIVLVASDPEQVTDTAEVVTQTTKRAPYCAARPAPWGEATIRANLPPR